MSKNNKNNDQKNQPVEYPQEVLKPVREHLVSRLFGLERRKKALSDGDPFNDKTRLNDNAAIDADAAEKVGHMEASALKSTADRSIIQIRKALSRIKIGKYGICERCGKMIDTDRLMVMPETTICIDCEKKRES